MKTKNRTNKADRNRARRIEENRQRIFDLKICNEVKNKKKKFRKFILEKMGENKESIKKLLDY